MLWDMLWRGSLHHHMITTGQEDGDGRENGPAHE